MAIKVFTNSFKGNGGSDDIAINEDQIISVFETKNESDENVTAIFTTWNQTFFVEEDFDTVLYLLNKE